MPIEIVRPDCPKGIKFSVGQGGWFGLGFIP